MDLFFLDPVDSSFYSAIVVPPKLDKEVIFPDFESYSSNDLWSIRIFLFSIIPELWKQKKMNLWSTKKEYE